MDLTHPLDAAFPAFDDGPAIRLEPLFTRAADGFNVNAWHLNEHVGTHLDAPIHFVDGPAADAADLAAEDLVVPLVVIDVAARAADEADTRLTPDDVHAHEARHGPVPAGACLAMHSGWERRLGGPAFMGLDGAGTMHFPGIHGETADLLLERGAAGLAVDTLSLDHGPSETFPTHTRWLPAGRWGLEAVANLSAIPPVGAFLVAGAPKVRGATGGPTRAIALVPAG